MSTNASPFERFLPSRAGNDYRGSKISLIVFGIVSLVLSLREPNATENEPALSPQSS